MTSRKTRFIFQALLLSILLNFTLIFIFFYFVFNRNPYHFLWSFKPAPEIEVMRAANLHPYFVKLKACSWEKLVEALLDERHIDAEYTVQDVALSALDAFFHFDVARGLGRPHVNKREIICAEGDQHILYPGLTQADFEKLASFAKREKFPFTPEGMFTRLKMKKDLELAQAFMATQPFYVIKLLFYETQVKSELLLDMILEGEWTQLMNFFEEQKKECDLSSSSRQTLLLQYFKCHSKIAGDLLMQEEPEWTCTHLRDEELFLLMNQIELKSQCPERFCKYLCDSKRSDSLKLKAMECLKHTNGEQEIANRFAGIGQLRPKFRDRPPAAPEPRTHIIQPGESLWGIAKKYGADMDQLMRVNKLQSTTIQSGKSLQIP